HPPLWLAALAARSGRWGIELGVDCDVISAPLRAALAQVEGVYEAFEQALCASGRERSRTRFALNRMTFVGADEAECREVLRYVLMNHRIIDQQLGGLGHVR